jgi:hypothetical protein
MAHISFTDAPLTFRDVMALDTGYPVLTVIAVAAYVALFTLLVPGLALILAEVGRDLLMTPVRRLRTRRATGVSQAGREAHESLEPDHAPKGTP